MQHKSGTALNWRDKKGNCKNHEGEQCLPIIVVTWVSFSISKSVMLAHLSFYFVLNVLQWCKAYSSGSVSSLIVFFCEPVYMGERITVRWRWWGCSGMPMVMESSMFCYVAADPFPITPIWALTLWTFMGVSDLLIMETICSKNFTCVCFLCNSGNKSCFCIWDREQALSVAMWVHFALNA